MNTVINKCKKNISFLIICIFITSPIIASAQLFVPVWDPANLKANSITATTNTKLSVKEFILDAVLYKIVDLIIQRMTASTVKWINSGFKKKPAFVTNPESFFLKIGDNIAGDFIYNNSKLKFLCGPLSAKIKVALSNKHSNIRNYRCSLTDISGNMEDFMNDFERGGWQKFFRLTQENQNNPIGAYIQAEGELFEKIASKQEAREKELSWGKGFLSFKTCPEGRSVTEVIDNPDGSITVTYEDGVKIDQAFNPDLEAGDCGVEGQTSTPGTVIEGQLGEVLSIGSKRLAVADEINELLSALLNQLMNRVIGGVGKGLRSLSDPDPINNNQTFLSYLSTSSNNAVIDNYIASSSQSLATEIKTPVQNPYACFDNPTLPECNPPPGTPVCQPGELFCTTTNTNTDIRSSCDPTKENCDAVNVGGSRSR